MRPRLLLSFTILSASWGLWRAVRPGAKGRQKARLVRCPGPLTSHTPDEISLVSYNILADHYCSGKKLPYVRPEYLSWPYRWSRLQEQFESFKSDFICLQEVEISRWAEISGCAALHGYTSLLQDRNCDHIIANAVFYRAERFSLIWCEHRSRALLAAFGFWDSQGGQQVLYIANVHLEGSPYRPNDRVSQMRSALQRLTQHQQQHGLDPHDCLLVIAGDLNSGRSETVCQFLFKGRLEGGSTEAHLPQVEVTKSSISHPYPLHEVYSSGQMELPFTRKVPSLSSTLDFIWATAWLRVSALYWPIDLQHERLIQHQSLPNQAYPSDHLPIGAVLQLRPGALSLAVEGELPMPEDDAPGQQQ